MPAPTSSEALLYLGDTSWTALEVGDAFAAERASQAKRCRVPESRSVTITTTDTDETVTADAGTFTAADVGREVEASGVASSTLVVSVASDGSSAVLSAAATASATVTATVHDVWGDDLKEALYRRVAHNLALRALPLGVQATMAETAVITDRVGGLDAEVRRLEAGYRRVVFG